MKGPICSICQKPQTLLDSPTDKQSLPVFVCTEKNKPRGMPCDGWIVNLPTARTE